MDIATKTNIILCILSFLLAIISVITVIVTLKQNSIMLENESRAYISIYGDTIECKGTVFYLVIKNFGKSNAIITSLECDTDLSKFSYIEEIKPFSHIENMPIAPNQAYRCALQQVPLFGSGIPSLNFKISYNCNNKKYSDTFCINLKAFTDLIHSRASVKSGKELEIIAYALQELLEKLL